MKPSDNPLAVGGSLESKIAGNGSRLAPLPISGSAAIACGPGTGELATTKGSKRSNGKAAKLSRDQPSPAQTKRARGTIAICLETISGQLDLLPRSSRIIILAEGIRRFTKRLETEGVALIERPDQENEE